MSKKEKTTQQSQTTSNVVTTPTNPQYVTDSIQAQQNRINNLANTDPSTLVAGASPLQTQAFSQAGSLGSTWQPTATQATAGANGVLGSTLSPTLASAGSLLGVDMSRYMNPELNAVVNTTLAANDEQAGMQRAQLAADQARGQKFSGSGAAITSSLFDRGALQDRAQLEAGLRSQAYDNATNLATQDLNRDAATSQFNAGQSNATAQQNIANHLGASSLLGDLSNADASNSRADLGLLSSVGGTQRDISQAQAQAPFTLASLIAALNSSQPYDLLKGGTTSGTTSGTATGTTKTTDPLAALSALLNGAGAAMSGYGAATGASGAGAA